MSADTRATDAVRPLLRVRQIREFTEEPVSTDALDAVADAARWSGSSTNSQPWRFVILRSVETLRTVAAAGMPQTRSLQSATAAVAVVLPEGKGVGISHAFDEGRAAERMFIAASFLDLGAAVAWILPEVRPLVASLLQLPEDRFVRTIVALGHPSAAARQPKSARGKARLPREETVFYERWGSSSAPGDS
ncbi:MAG: nitroreductase family protein [Chloroflexota bacterium]